MNIFKYFIVIGPALFTAGSLLADEKPDQVLSRRNREAPFCYLVGRARSWPILASKLSADSRLLLTTELDGRPSASAAELLLPGLRISVSRDGLLSVQAAADADLELQLEVTVRRQEATTERQVLTVRAAPPARPISYVSDLVDDLIRIFWDESIRRFRPLEKGGFDQYFRRLQAQGITRLVVWQSPFPLIVDPSNYDPSDWQRYESQARAILASVELTEDMRSTPQLKSYQWLRYLMGLRLSTDFDRMFTDSARQHGIKLTASFRPFEAALTKYYVVPAFDSEGEFLWDFLPAASPVVANHPDQVGFAHYRQILRRMGKPDQAKLSSIEIDRVGPADELARRFLDGQTDIELWASPFPPLDETSFVLVRNAAGHFALQPYKSIRKQARSRQVRLTDFHVAVDQVGRLNITGIKLPDSHRYLILRSASDFGDSLEIPVVLPVTMRSTTGNQLGRVNVYCALRGPSPAARQTRVAGIPRDGLYRTGFQAIENSVDHFRRQGVTHWRLGQGELVCDLGSEWSVEMMDFNQPAARQFALRQLDAILARDAFDEILINTRSHTQLAASTGDGSEGIQPLAYYRLQGHRYHHYGIDRAYAPIALSAEPLLRQLAADLGSIERITTWQAGEWQGACQSPESPYVWRFRRNRAVARGVRALLQDLQGRFPNLRIRAVIPPSGDVEDSFQRELETMTKAKGGVYGREYYRSVRGSLNHIPAIGEGMSMVDLSDLSVEPVFLGTRFRPDQAPLEAFVARCIEDLADNRGSRFHGARSFFYEAQETLRGGNRKVNEARRDDIIRYLLGQPADIREVLLYEAADWTYYVPLADPWQAVDTREIDAERHSPGGVR